MGFLLGFGGFLKFLWVFDGLKFLWGFHGVFEKLLRFGGFVMIF